MKKTSLLPILLSFFVFYTVNAQVEATKTFVGHESAVKGVAISPDGQYVVSAGYDKTIKLWDVETTELIKSITLANPVYAVCFSADGTKVAVAGGTEAPMFAAELILFSMPDLKEEKKLQGHTQKVNAVRFSPNGKFLASCSSDQTVRVFSMRTGNEFRKLEHGGKVYSLDFSSDNNFIVSGGADKKVYIWNVMNNQLVKQLDGHTNFIKGISISSDVKLIASASGDKTVKIWDFATGKMLGSYSGHTNVVHDVKFMPNMKSIFTCSKDNTIKQLNLQGGLLNSFEGHAKEVNSIAVSNDNIFVISGAADKTIKYWEIK